MTYNTVVAIEQIQEKIALSKFIGYAYEVLDEDAIKSKLNAIKQLHPKATHICYAYRLGLTKNNYRANDDGEPSGTAGKPILNQIDSFNLTNCLLIVVRYFGGTKLGVSGLISAYKSCAKTTIEATEIVTKEIKQTITIKRNEVDANTIFSQLNRYQIEYSIQKIATDIIFTIHYSDEQLSIIEQLR